MRLILYSYLSIGGIFSACCPEMEVVHISEFENVLFLWQSQSGGGGGRDVVCPLYKGDHILESWLLEVPLYNINTKNVPPIPKSWRQHWGVHK